MPSKSEKQRELFAVALAHKKNPKKGVYGKAKELSKLPSKTLADYAKKVKPGAKESEVIEESIASTMAHGKVFQSFKEWKENQKQ